MTMFIIQFDTVPVLFILSNVFSVQVLLEFWIIKALALVNLRCRTFIMCEKIVCMRKNAEINKISAPEVHLEKIVCRDQLCYAIFGEFKKNCLHSRSGEKSLQALNRWWKRNFLTPRNHDTFRGKVMVRPLARN